MTSNCPNDVINRTRYIRTHRVFSDLQVHIQGHVFHCHRYVLAQHSDVLLTCLQRSDADPSFPLSKAPPHTSNKQSAISDPEHTLLPLHAVASADHITEQTERASSSPDYLGSRPTTVGNERTSKSSDDVRTFFVERERLHVNLHSDRLKLKGATVEEIDSIAVSPEVLENSNTVSNALQQSGTDSESVADVSCKTSFNPFEEEDNGDDKRDVIRDVEDDNDDKVRTELLPSVCLTNSLALESSPLHSAAEYKLANARYGGIVHNRSTSLEGLHSGYVAYPSSDSIVVSGQSCSCIQNYNRQLPSVATKQSPSAESTKSLPIVSKIRTRSGYTTIVELSELTTADAFDIILDFVYFGNLNISRVNAVPLYKGAVRLQISSLVRVTEDVLAQLLQTGELSAAAVLKDKEMASSSTISQAALGVLLTDFGHDSGDTLWFLELTPADLLTALSDQRLNVREEDDVYRALLAWYRHQPLSRQRHLLDALLQIRLCNLSRRVLVEELLPLVTVTCPNVEADGDVTGHGHRYVILQQAVQRALAYHILPDRRHDELLPSAVFRPSQASERVLLVLGDLSDKLYAYSFARRAWFKLAPPPQPLGLGVEACTHADDLYTTGGDKAMNKVFRYRTRTNTWKRLKDMNVGRRSHVMAAVNDHIYVLGGKDDNKSSNKDTLDSVEVLNLEAKGEGWVKVTGSGGSLPVPVRSMGRAVVGNNIYLIGGRTNGFQKDVDAIQCFDTVTRQCTLIAHLAASSCLARPFVAHKVTFLLEVTGDVTLFQPQEQAQQVDMLARHAFIRNSDAVLTTYHSSSAAPQSLQAADTTRLLTRTHTNHRGTPAAKGLSGQPVVRRVANVRGLDWKWAGVARDHRGVLYVVGGERPPNPPQPSLSLVVDVDFATNGRHGLPCPCCLDKATRTDGGGGGGGGGGTGGSERGGGGGGGGGGVGDRSGCNTHFTDVQFICPEKMRMCYVTAHACVPKQFLLEKLP